MASFFKTTIVCILICLDISLLVASTEDFGDFASRGSTKRFCGRMLTESLAMICNGEYQSLTEKRSGKHECTSYFHLVKAFLFHTKMKLIHDLPVCFRPDYIQLKCFVFEHSIAWIAHFSFDFTLLFVSRWIHRWLCIQRPTSWICRWFANTIPNICVSIENSTRIDWSAISCTT